MPQKYEIIVKCDNCGEKNSLDIPKGTLIIDFEKVIICSNCGCNVKALSLSGTP